MQKFIALGLTALLAVGCTGDTEKTKPKRKRSKRSSSSSSSSSAEWVGTFRGPKLTLAVKQGKDEQLEGTITQGAQRFPFTGTPNGSSLEGTFTAGGNALAFRAELSGDDLSFETGEGDAVTTYALKRVAQANPLAGKTGGDNPLAGGAGGQQDPTATDPWGGGGKPSDPAPTNPAPTNPAPTNPEPTTPSESTRAPASWPSLTHNGFSMRYPPDWKAQSAGEGAAVLTPPDLARNAQGQQAELYAVRGAPSGGAKRADEPKAIAFYDQEMRKSFPGMRRQGSAKTLPGGGAALTYVGKNPQTGQQIVASLHAIVIDGFGFMLFGVAEAGQLAKREPTLRQIFATFRFKQPKNDDPRLVGAWRNTRTYMSGKFSSVTERYLLLTSDGRCYGGGRMAASMEHTRGGRYAGGSTLDTGDKKGWEYAGKWFAANRTLTLMWSNGNREYYGYYICDGKSLLLRQSRQQKKGGLLFSRYR